ncbi:MAG: site-2 protease family protein [Elusimicrobiaceae bacterium]|nr:site-2 protease family protein [Elusimicrobiaceae bacterium]
MLLSIIAVLVVLSPIVIVHEFGHYVACRLTGIRVKEFSFGFGKVLWHKKAGDTDYQLRAIPFGGFVEPAGPMFHPEGATQPPQPYEFAAKPWYAKFFMVINGALFNYLLAALIFSVLIFIKGMPEDDPIKMAPVVGSIAEHYPAAGIDLKEGDIITVVNETPVTNWQELTDILAQREGDLQLTYKRGEEILSATVKDTDFNPASPKVLGITVLPEYHKVSAFAAVGYGFYQCYYWTKYSLQSLGKSFSQKKAPDLAGPIGIVNIIHQSVHRGLLDFIFLIAMLSVAVGMFNLFPIPILDGGYAMVYLWEGITHKLPTEKTLNVAVNIGLYLLILLFVYASYSDIKRIFFKPKTTVEQTVEPQPSEAENVQE